MEKIANSDFQSVLTLAKETFFDQLSKYPRESYKKDILLDDENCFRAILEMKNCMCELIVENGDFTPYRFVNFTIVPSDSDEINSVYCYHDSESETLENVKSCIQKGIKAGFLYTT